ncbi:MAG: undecaprenyl-diphosphate phosphatase [Lachnospiraceae bacterium]|nr:undecaprenyl-diphosphate phosphatase [Lachnospiraceae bacterium]MBQ4068451.1 undecaprenyl-diphosphate phosphatase [Lachnospiraceae bacterium]
MNIIEAIILGLVQGLAEFLPISSSGHLAIAKELFGLDDVGLAFDLLLHLGTLVAVFVAFYKDIWELIVEGCGIIKDACINIVYWFKKKAGNNEIEYVKVVSTPYRRFVMLVIISTIPTGVMGLLFKEIFNLDNPILLIPAISLLLTGCLLLLADSMPSGKTTEKNATYLQGAIIGISQGFATLPGLSRSGTTITCCLACGFEKKFAVKYSFIMSIPAIIGANILELGDLAGTGISSQELIYYIIGTVVAAISGYICIKTMLVVVRKNKFKYFAYYCFAIGLLSGIVYFVK